MVFRNGGKPSSSHMFNLRDVISGNGSIRSHQFIEEKRWPTTLETMRNQGNDGKLQAGLEWIDNLQPPSNPFLYIPVSVDPIYDTRSSRSNSRLRSHSDPLDSVVMDDCLESRLIEPSLWHQVTRLLLVNCYCMLGLLSNSIKLFWMKFSTCEEKAWQRGYKLNN